ncbi:MAG: rod shape-determining protein MreC [bacterium]|nr:rod shape-determining protein MreC [bacterium]
MTKKYIIFFLLLAVLFLFFFYQKNIFFGLDKINLSSQILTDLRLENQGLRQEVNDLKNKLNLKSQPYLTAQVYLRYPFDDNQTLIVDVGSKDGVKVGWPVLTVENYFLGKIINVKADVSEVRTIFSPDWKSEVKIGEMRVEAVLVGGRQPILQLIPADSKINLGDAVTSASPDLPLGLFVGKVSEITPRPAASLQQAKLITDYDPNKLGKVLIISGYEGIN